jgi:hypothetical protein
MIDRLCSKSLVHCDVTSNFAGGKNSDYCFKWKRGNLLYKLVSSTNLGINRINSDLFSFFRNFNIHIGEMTFCKADFIIIKSNYFQNAQKTQCFLDDFEALVREIYICCVVILKLVSSKTLFPFF